MLPSKKDICLGVRTKPMFDVASVVRYLVEVFMVKSSLIVLIAFCFFDDAWNESCGFNPVSTFVGFC